MAGDEDPGYAAVLGMFLIVGPDAWFSALVWHPSLYTAAMCLVLTAGIRLPIESRWWAAELVAVPGLYALTHYPGVILFAPALALLVVSRRAWKQLLTPASTRIHLRRRHLRHQRRQERAAEPSARRDAR